MLTYRNGHIVPLTLIKGNLHYLSHFSGKVVLKFFLVRHKTHSIISHKCANSALSRYITSWVRELRVSESQYCAISNTSKVSFPVPELF